MCKTIYRFQQICFQFSAVLLQIEDGTGLERHLLTATRQHDELAAVPLGDKLAELRLRFLDCERFHVASLGAAVTSLLAHAPALAHRT